MLDDTYPIGDGGQDKGSHRVALCPSPQRRGELYSELKDLLGDISFGIYLFEQRGDRVIVWRISEGEPSEEAFAPASLWPLSLPPDS